MSSTALGKFTKNLNGLPTSEIVRSYQPWVCLTFLLAILVMLGTDRIAPEIISFGAVMAMWLLRVIGTTDALSGFCNTGILTIGAMFVIMSAVERSVIVTKLIDASLKSSNLRISLMKLMILVCLVSSVVNNAPVVALFMPLVRNWCRRNRVPRSKMYIPIAYMAVCAGMNSIIGTSTNLVVQGLLVKFGLREFSLFEQAKVGIVMSVVCMVYIQIIFKYLPSSGGLFQYVEKVGFLTKIVVSEDTVRKLPENCSVRQFVETLGLEPECVREVVCDAEGPNEIEILLEGSETPRNVGIDDVVRAGDILLLSIRPENIEAIEKYCPLSGSAPGKRRKLVEVVLSYGPIIGLSNSDDSFSKRYGPTVLAARNGETTSCVDGWQFSVGDTLLLAATDDEVQKLKSEYQTDFSALSEYNIKSIEWKDKTALLKDIVPLIIFLAYVVLAACSIIEAVEGAFCVAIIFILAGFVPGGRANFIEVINARVLFVSACMIGFATAVEKSGLASLITDLLLRMQISKWGYYTVLHLIMVVVTEFVSNNACAAIGFPICVEVAKRLNANPYPFVMGLMYSSAIGFANPLGDHTHLLVYGPGGYNFKQYLKFGIPLDILLSVVHIVLVPIIYGL